jgi:hypothetical protein
LVKPGPGQGGRRLSIRRIFYILTASKILGFTMSDKEGFTEHDWRRFLASLGEDPNRAGLHETPARVAKAWKHWTSGYDQDPVEILKAFEDGAEEYNELAFRSTAIANTTWRRSSARPRSATCRTGRSSGCPSSRAWSTCLQSACRCRSA